MFQTNIIDETKTHIFYSIFFFYNSAFCEIMWKNIVDRGRPYMTVWLMRFAYWITKATNTNSQYVTLIAYPLQQWLPEGSSVLRCTNTACLLTDMTYQ